MCVTFVAEFLEGGDGQQCQICRARRRWVGVCPMLTMQRAITAAEKLVACSRGSSKKGAREEAEPAWNFIFPRECPRERRESGQTVELSGEQAQGQAVFHHGSLHGLA